MRVPSPTSRSGTRIYLSLWDLFWALATPILALYLRDADIVFRGDWNVLAYYWLFSSGFALLAFVTLRLQDGLTRNFSVHEALDIAEAALFTELMTFLAFHAHASRWHSTFNATHARIAAGRGAYCSQDGCARRVERRQAGAGLPLSPRARHSDRGKSLRLVFHPIA